MKKNKMKKYFSYLGLWRNIFSIVLYYSNKDLINQDIERLLHTTPFEKANILSFNYVMLFNKPFRSVYRFRIISKNKLFGALLWLTPKTLSTIEIGGTISGGLAVFHSIGAVIAVEKAGKNLSVGQGVTIGRNDSPNSNGQEFPIIGNNVRICTNSVVFGPITIGDNVTIGAGTVLFRSVPANCTVVGNPARIVSIDGKRCDIKLS